MTTITVVREFNDEGNCVKETTTTVVSQPQPLTIVTPEPVYRTINYPAINPYIQRPVWVADSTPRVSS